MLPAAATLAPRAPESALWQCPICLDTLDQPMLTTCCGQSFCRACLDGALAKVDACPMCRAPLLSGRHTMTRNRALEELLRRMTPVAGGGEREVLITIRDDAPQPEDDEEEKKPTRWAQLRRHVLSGWRVLPAPTMPTTLSTLRIQQWHHWLRIHWATLQCVFYVLLFGALVFFLRIQEEEFAEHDLPHGHH